MLKQLIFLFYAVKICCASSSSSSYASSPATFPTYPHTDDYYIRWTTKESSINKKNKKRNSSKNLFNLVEFQSKYIINIINEINPSQNLVYSSQNLLYFDFVPPLIKSEEKLSLYEAVTKITSFNRENRFYTPYILLNLVKFAQRFSSPVELHFTENGKRHIFTLNKKANEEETKQNKNLDLVSKKSPWPANVKRDIELMCQFVMYRDHSYSSEDDVIAFEIQSTHNDSDRMYFNPVYDDLYKKFRKTFPGLSMEFVSPMVAIYKKI